MRNVCTVLAACAAIIAGGVAQADFNLQITEIYHGQENPDPTEDWFELTNFGDMPWVRANDGPLFFDDDSMDPLVADELMGVDEIAPGQSVIFIDDVDTATFLNVWSNVSGLTVGTYQGSGLSGGGDGVTLFTGMLNPFPDPPTVGAIIDFEAYPDPALVGGADGATWDVELQAYSTVGNLAGAVASVGTGGPGGAVPAIGSPGSRIPEPTGIGLALVGLLSLLARRTRNQR